MIRFVFVVFIYLSGVGVANADEGAAINSGVNENNAYFLEFKKWAKSVDLQGNIFEHWKEFTKYGEFKASALASGANGPIYTQTLFAVDWNAVSAKGFEDPAKYQAPMDKAVRDYRTLQEISVAEETLGKSIEGKLNTLENYKSVLEETYVEFLAADDNLVGAAVESIKEELVSELTKALINQSLIEGAKRMVGNNKTKESPIDKSFTKTVSGIVNKAIGLAQDLRNAAFKGGLTGLNNVAVERARLSERLEAFAKQVEGLNKTVSVDIQALNDLEARKQAIRQ